MIGLSVLPQIRLVTDVRMDGLYNGIGITYGRRNISLLFETHPGLLLETLEQEPQRSGPRTW